MGAKFGTMAPCAATELSAARLLFMRMRLLCTLLLCSTVLMAQRSALETARNRLQALGLAAGDLQDLRVTDSYTDPRTGIQHTWFRQQHLGIDIFNSEVAVHTRANGEVVHLTHRLVSDLAGKAKNATPAISAEDALRQVLRNDGVLSAEPVLARCIPERHRWEFTSSASQGAGPFAELVWLAVGDRLLLAWNVNHLVPDGSHWWNVRIDAMSGKELERNDWVASCGHHDRPDAPEHPLPMPAAPNDLRVLSLPVESPNHGARALRNAPWTLAPNASPYGWFDADGVVGADFNITRGNNAYACEDVNADNLPGTSPSSATLDFDFPLNLANAPSTYQSASITNLFYVCNVMHDVFYQYGFDEVSGNFQQNNYGNGGVGNDFVYADGQDGMGTNNGSFGTPPDGQNPRMTIMNWTFTSPNRDGCLDNGLVTHEYAHGISNRLVGGPGNANTLANQDQPGEGWSDWIALMMTMEPGDQGTDVRGLDTYLLGQPTTGTGIRPFPYTTNPAVNSLTYANTNSSAMLPNAHGIGTMWCSVLWDITWDLIAQYGFSADLYNGTAGNNIALHLVIEGMRYTPGSPGFVDARDGILVADQVLYGGANQDLLWAAFAARGLGFSASQGNPYWRFDQVEAFDLPTNNNVGVRAAHAPAPGIFHDCDNGLPVTMTIRNNGFTTQGNFNVSYRVDGGTIVTQLYPGTLQPGFTAQVTFPGALTFSGYGPHTIKAWTSLATDGYHADDTLTYTVNWQANAPTPMTANAEDALLPPSGWTAENPDGLYTWSNVSLAMGANCGTTRAFRMNYRTYNAPGQPDRLVSPLINLAGSAGSRLQFHHAYAPYGSGLDDGLTVRISTDCGANWTTIYTAFGAALATAPQTTSQWVPTACNQWQFHDIDLSAYDGQLVLIHFEGESHFGNDLFIDNINVVNTGVRLALKVLLEGPYDANTQLMSDALRTAGLVPASEPYTALGFLHAGGGGGESRQAGALTGAGNNAIVDWVLVELRDNATGQSVVATRSALLQRDGDVVAEDGSSPIAFEAAPGNYKVAVRHRNHLGAMTNGSIAMSATPTSLDLSLPATATHGTEARKNIGARAALWAGNCVRDGTVSALKYIGAGNDRDPVLVRIGGLLPNNTVTGYWSEDVNMDGVVKYTGTLNDRDPILVNIGGSSPNNVRTEQLP